MGSRPLRYTFATYANSLDLTSIQLTDLMLPATSGWSVSVESVFISGIADTTSLGLGLALNVTTNIANTLCHTIWQFLKKPCIVGNSFITIKRVSDAS